MQGAKDFLGGMGLGMIASQLADLRLGDLLDTPPPGLDEAVAIAKVIPTSCSTLTGCLTWSRQLPLMHQLLIGSAAG